MNTAEESEYAFPPLLVVDAETTGIDPERHSIVELGAVWLCGSGYPASFAMECRMWDGAEYDPGVEAVNGRSEAACTNPILPTEADLIREFSQYLGGDSNFILAGLNPSFDRNFLLAAAKRAGLTEFRVPHRTLDLHSLVVADALSSRAPVPKRGFYTDQIYEYLELPPEPKPHCALTGATREAEAFEVLLDL